MQFMCGDHFQRHSRRFFAGMSPCAARCTGAFETMAVADNEVNARGPRRGPIIAAQSSKRQRHRLFDEHMLARPGPRRSRSAHDIDAASRYKQSRRADRRRVLQHPHRLPHQIRCEPLTRFRPRIAARDNLDTWIERKRRRHETEGPPKADDADTQRRRGSDCMRSSRYVRSGSATRPPSGLAFYT